ncbi:CsiV family protein [Elongatibacter sediminis]|uniref:CsiV family protein n=1 Tax=Elongatibacter sediminis TaxID=3119006 RepID=A0AAW9R744_9GAMM
MTALAAAEAEETETRYRVELLVLRHLDSTADPRLEEYFRDFSEALDLRAPKTDDEVSADPANPAANESTANTASGPGDRTETGSGEVLGQSNGDKPGTSDLSQQGAGDSAIADAGEPPLGSAGDEMIEEPPEPVATLIEEPGETLSDAWRRLRQSAGFRPLLYFSWEQSENEPFPSLRVHDDELLHEDDPWAELRLPSDPASGALAGSQPPAEFGDVPSGPVPSSQMPNAQPAGETPPPEAAGSHAATDTALPDPRRFYRLDGTARLRRSRFLHLELDLEWREPQSPGIAYPDALDSASIPADPAPLPDTPVSAPSGMTGPVAGGDTARETPPAIAVYHLQQSRQVRTDQVEYFDGPFLGVLAVISRIEVPVEPRTPDVQSAVGRTNADTRRTNENTLTNRPAGALKPAQ